MTSKPSEITKGNGEIKTRPSAVTLTFKTVWDRRGVYIKRMKIGRNIFISEDLTKEENALYTNTENQERSKSSSQHSTTRFLPLPSAKSQ